MLYREIIVICSEIHTDTLCGLNVDLLFVKPGGTYSDHWDLEDWCLQAIFAIVCSETQWRCPTVQRYYFWTGGLRKFLENVCTKCRVSVWQWWPSAAVCVTSVWSIRNAIACRWRVVLLARNVCRTPRSLPACPFQLCCALINPLSTRLQERNLIFHSF
jgi:hypothetical protein